MPNSVSRPMIPFVGERFDPRTRLGDYARQSGRDTAQSIRRGGDLSAQMWQGIGQNVAGSLRDIAAYPEQQRAQQRQDMLLQREDQAYQAAEQAKQADAAKAQRLQELVKEHGGRVPSDRLLQEFGPEDAADINQAFDKIFPAPKAPEPFTLNPGDTRFDGTGKPIANVPKPEPVVAPKLHPVTVAGPDGRPLSQMFTEEQLQKGVPTYQAQKAPAEPRAATEISLAVAAASGDPDAKAALQVLRDQRVGSGGNLTAQDRRRAARVNAASGFLERLNTLREKINTKMGPAAGLTGMVRRGAANVGMDPDVAEYERIRAAGGRSLAVAIMGAQNLSDADAKAWADMLPGATVDRETAKRLTDQIGTMLSDMTSDLGGASKPVTKKNPFKK